MANPTNFGRFVWYELMTADTTASQAFYTQVLGWGTRVERPLMGIEGRPPYTMLTANETPIAGLVPLEETYWLGYVGVDDVGRSVTQAKELGADILFGPHEISNVGRFAVLADPQGAPIAVFQSADNARPPQPFRPKTLEFSWHELAATDWRASLRFYGAMFGWETISENDMGPLGTYLIFGQHGVPYGGMFDKAAETSHAAWCYYVRVDDVHAMAGRVLQHGGQVSTGPTEVPGGDWIVQCRDQAGATFALHQIARG